MIKNQQIQVMGADISILKIKDDDYICITDIARYKNPLEPKDVIKNWLRTKNTIEFLGLWESINNQYFKGVEFESFRNSAGSNSFTMSPQKWIEQTNSIGLISRSGKNGGTYAHKDIAIKFASWVSVEFELYLIKEFQRLKEQEIKSLDWSVKRFLTKVNYKIHTDAIKENLIPKVLSKSEINFVYTDEADILNKSLFGITAKDWRDQNPHKKGNIRDEATIEQLIILANIESMNAEFIKMGMNQHERIELLNRVAITQMKSLLNIDLSSRLPENSD